MVFSTTSYYDVPVTESDGENWVATITSTLPAFVSFSYNSSHCKFTFGPTIYSDVGSHLFKMKVQDIKGYANEKSFTLFVTNTPPTFVSALPGILHAHLG